MNISPTEKCVHKVETEAVSVEKERLAKVQSLTERLNEAQSALVEAQGVPEALLRDAWAGGDVPKGALTQAKDEVEVAAAKVEGLSASLALLSKGSVSQDASVADLLSPLFQRSLLGVPVITSVAPFTKVLAAVKDIDGPALVLCQEHDTKHVGSGYVSADRVNVVFVRPSWGADIKVTDLENDARKMGIAIRVTSNGSSGNHQTFAIHVESAVEAVPLIEATQSMGVNAAMQSFGAATVYHLGEYPQLPVIRNGVYTYAGQCQVDLTPPDVAEDIDADGVRTMHLTFSCHIRRGGLDRDYVWAAPRKVEAQGFQEHLGRFTAVEVKDATADPRGGTVSQTVTLTYVSRVR